MVLSESLKINSFLRSLRNRRGHEPKSSFYHGMEFGNSGREDDHMAKQLTKTLLPGRCQLSEHPMGRCPRIWKPNAGAIPTQLKDHLIYPNS
jgi:hypothetical protein